MEPEIADHHDAFLFKRRPIPVLQERAAAAAVPASYLPAPRLTSLRYLPHRPYHAPTDRASAILQESTALNVPRPRSLNRASVEDWLNSVLTRCRQELSGPDTGPRRKPAKKGLELWGLERSRLLGRGLLDAAVDGVYRSIFTFSTGFYEQIKQVARGSRSPMETLSATWTAFLAISQHLMAAHVKSDALEILAERDNLERALGAEQAASAASRAECGEVEAVLTGLAAQHSQQAIALEQAKREAAAVRAALEAAGRDAGGLADLLAQEARNNALLRRQAAELRTQCGLQEAALLALCADRGPGPWEAVEQLRAVRGLGAPGPEEGTQLNPPTPLQPAGSAAAAQHAALCRALLRRSLAHAREGSREGQALAGALEALQGLGPPEGGPSLERAGSSTAAAAAAAGGKEAVA